MSAFCEDTRQILNYPNGIIGQQRGNGVPLIDCLQWSENQQGRSSFETVQDFIDAGSATPYPLRIAFLPIAPVKDSSNEASDFRALFTHFSFPSAVPGERLRNVGLSFGTTKHKKDKSEGAWFHFLCRKVEINEGKIQDLGYLRHGNAPGQKPDPSKMWTMCDFYVHIDPAQAKNGNKKSVTLLCFGAPKEVYSRFRHLLGQPEWNDVLSEPYLLFDILFDELHGVFDGAVWELSGAVNPEEKAALERADNEGKHDSLLSFQNLHNIQKNITFMIEAAEASIITLEAMIARLNRKAAVDLTIDTADALEYRKRSFQSTLLRLHSLEKRMSNVIQLSFNLVTQADSSVLKTDSRAMKFIAFLTLVFLPATGVASVFSTPFFDIDWESGGTEEKVLRTARSFWIFWAVVLPLTLVGLLLCFAWVNLPEDYKKKIKTYIGKLALSGRGPISRRNTLAFGNRDVEKTAGVTSGNQKAATVNLVAANPSQASSSPAANGSTQPRRNN